MKIIGMVVLAASMAVAQTAPTLLAKPANSTALMEQERQLWVQVQQLRIKLEKTDPLYQQYMLLKADDEKLVNQIGVERAAEESAIRDAARKAAAASPVPK